MTSKITPGTHKFNQKTKEVRPKLGQIIENSTKNGGRSALYFLLLGMSFGRQSTGLIEISKKSADPFGVTRRVRCVLLCPLLLSSPWGARHFQSGGGASLKSPRCLPYPCPVPPWTSLKNTFKKEALFCEQKSPQNEYSGPPGSQNYSKMEAKMEPRHHRPTLTKPAPAWTDCMSTPLGELHFSSFFKDPLK